MAGIINFLLKCKNQSYQEGTHPTPTPPPTPEENVFHLKSVVHGRIPVFGSVSALIVPLHQFPF